MFSGAGLLNIEMLKSDSILIGFDQEIRSTFQSRR